MFNRSIHRKPPQNRANVTCRFCGDVTLDLSAIVLQLTDTDENVIAAFTCTCGLVGEASVNPEQEEKLLALGTKLVLA